MDLKDYLYYEDDWATIYCGDCLEVMPLLNPIDAVITDPIWPNKPSPKLTGHKNPYSLFTRAAKHFPRLAKRVAIHLSCASDPRFFSKFPKEMVFFRVCWLRYARPAYIGRLLHGSDVVYLFGEPPTPRPGQFVISGEMVRTHNLGKETDHPAARPYAFVKWIVGKWSNENEIILDPFLGSGTTCVAAKNLNRKSIGIEINPDYCEMAVKRLRQEVFDFS